jgi:hypothetical protein
MNSYMIFIMNLFDKNMIEINYEIAQPGESMNRFRTAKRIQTVARLAERSSINSMVRMMGVAKHTVLQLIEDIGCSCAAYHRRNVRGLKVHLMRHISGMHMMLGAISPMEAGVANHLRPLLELVELLACFRGDAA